MSFVAHRSTAPRRLVGLRPRVRPCRARAAQTEQAGLDNCTGHFQEMKANLRVSRGDSRPKARISYRVAQKPSACSPEWGTRAIETGLRPSGSVRPTTMQFFEAALGTASRGSAGLHATAPRQAAKSMAPPGSQPPHTPIRAPTMAPKTVPVALGSLAVGAGQTGAGPPATPASVPLPRAWLHRATAEARAAQARR
jgi:hypothetical protein